jgi:hypothetical protein
MDANIRTRTLGEAEAQAKQEEVKLEAFARMRVGLQSTKANLG